MEAFDEIGARSPKNSSVQGAIMTSAANAAGGFAAGRVRGMIAQAFPSFAPAGTVGVFAISVAVRMYFTGGSTTDSIARELAAGMSGFVGNDLWGLLKDWLGIGKWRKETSYKSGEVVKFDGKLYKANADIPYPPGGEPGRDARWVQVVTQRAQGVEYEDVRQFAQALFDNKPLMEGIMNEQFPMVERELSGCIGREFSDEERNRMYAGMRNAMYGVVDAFARG